MIERALIEYLINALWQVPLLAGGAWLLLRTVRPGPLAQHRVWLAVLGLAVLLPLHGMRGTVGFARQSITVSAKEHVAQSEEPLSPSRKNGWRWPGRHWLEFSPRMRSVHLAETTARRLVRLYVAVMAFGLFRIARAWRAARHLVEHSHETTLCHRDRAAFEDYGRRLRVKLPQLRESGEVSSPMIVGVAAAVLLLPEGFARHTEDEIRAALCHELAHIKRRDYLLNVICQLAGLPVAWHPVVFGVQRCVRSTREMVCDAMAAQEMQSQVRYAKCLLALAQSMLGGCNMAERMQVLGLFGNNILEERVMRLMATKAISVRAKVARFASGAAVVIAISLMAAMFHVTPTMADEKVAAPPQAVQNAPAASPSQPTLNRERQEPTVEKRPRIEKKSKHQMDDAQRQMAKATAKLNSLEFKQQMDDAQRQMAEATAKLNSPEFKQKMDDAQRQMSKAMAKLNSPEFKQKMDDLQKQLQSGELQGTMEEFNRRLKDALAQGGKTQVK